ncbi:DUF6185 family protein [Nonomuraea sp. NPDC050663]|uniref:DUF6185 family protein n=1 Tax=Nonomuraea sp. NPDC050663 TaxID=3364370 RepID=UPI003788F05E
MFVRLLILAFSAVCTLLLTGEPAHARGQECALTSLGEPAIELSTEIGDGETLRPITTRATILVPRTWEIAADLLREEPDAEYRYAMRCVLGAWWWPTDDGSRPVVTLTGEHISVAAKLKRYPWREQKEYRAFWEWDVRPGAWTLRLLPANSASAWEAIPPVVSVAEWRAVRVTAKGMAIKQLSPQPTSRDGRTLVWTPAGGERLPIQVVLAPSTADDLVFGVNAWPAWMSMLQYYAANLTFFILLAVLAVRLHRRHGPAGRRVARGLALVIAAAVVMRALALIDDILPAVAGVYNWKSASYLTHPGGEPLPAYHLENQLGVWLTSVWVVVTPAVWCSLLALIALPLWWRSRPGRAWRWLVATGLALPVVFAWALTLYTVKYASLFTTGASKRLEVNTLNLENVILAALQGLLMGVVVLGLIRRVLNSSPDRLPIIERVHRLFVVPALAVLAIASPIQHTIRLMISAEEWAWFSEDTAVEWGQDFLLAYPHDLINWVADQQHLLVQLALLVALHQLRKQPLDRTARFLLALLLMEAVMGWTWEYAGLDLPLAAIAGTAALLACLRWGRRRSVIPSAGAQNLSARHLAELAREQRRLETRARALDRSLSSVETEWDRDDSDRKEISDSLTALRRRVGLGDDPAITPLDVALSWGPGRNWWHNGRIAAKYTLIAAVPAMAINTWLTWSENFPRQLATNYFSLNQLAVHVLSSLAFWACSGMVLGCLWRELPGRRGYTKTLAILLAVAIDAAVYFAFQLASGVSAGFEPYLISLVMQFIVLTCAGVMMDLRTLQRQRSVWSRRFEPLLAVYRITTASTAVPILLAQVVAIVGLWQQVKNGVDLGPAVEPSRGGTTPQQGTGP